MNPAYYIPIAMLLLILFLTQRNQNKAVLARQIKKRKTEDRARMTELARGFIGKECIVYTFNGTQLEGIVKEVTAGALLLEKAGAPEVINLDFIVRIREYPRGKNGKKKSVVLD